MSLFMFIASDEQLNDVDNMKKKFWSTVCFSFTRVNVWNQINPNQKEGNLEIDIEKNEFDSEFSNVKYMSEDNYSISQMKKILLQ